MKIKNNKTGQIIETIKNQITGKDIPITDSLGKNLCYSNDYSEVIEAKKPAKKKPGPKKKEEKAAFKTKEQKLSGPK